MRIWVFCDVAVLYSFSSLFKWETSCEALYLSSLKHLLQQERCTVHACALIPFLLMCVLPKCLQLFRILFSCECLHLKVTWFFHYRRLPLCCTSSLPLSCFQNRCGRCKSFQIQRMYHSLNMYTVCFELKPYKQEKRVTRCGCTNC